MVKENSKFLELANELNKLYGVIKQGGDFSFSSTSQEILDTKRFIEENYSRLNVGILGFLVELIRDHPDTDFEFVPAENGISINFVYKVQGQVSFDENGMTFEQGSKTKNENLFERTSD